MSDIKPIPYTIEQLKNIVSYDLENGVVCWNYNSRHTKKGHAAGTLYKNGTNSYVRICISRRNYFAHRIAWYLHYGTQPCGIIDHIDGDGTNNHIENLRETTIAINGRNARMNRMNSSGYCGVIWHKRKRLWQSQIKVDGATRFLGLYKTRLAAAYARHQAEIENGFTSRHGK